MRTTTLLSPYLYGKWFELCGDIIEKTLVFLRALNEESRRQGKFKVFNLFLATLFGGGEKCREIL